eukprot:568862-Alexandrium_andersonii.AAC.1
MGLSRERRNIVFAANAASAERVKSKSACLHPCITHAQVRPEQRASAAQTRASVPDGPADRC